MTNLGNFIKSRPLIKIIPRLSLKIIIKKNSRGMYLRAFMILQDFFFWSLTCVSLDFRRMFNRVFWVFPSKEYTILALISASDNL